MGGRGTGKAVGYGPWTIPPSCAEPCGGHSAGVSVCSGETSSCHFPHEDARECHNSSYNCSKRLLYHRICDSIVCVNDGFSLPAVVMKAECLTVLLKRCEGHSSTWTTADVPRGNTGLLFTATMIKIVIR